MYKLICSCLVNCVFMMPRLLPIRLARRLLVLMCGYWERPDACWGESIMLWQTKESGDVNICVAIPSESRYAGVRTRSLLEIYLSMCCTVNAHIYVNCEPDLREIESFVNC